MVMARHARGPSAQTARSSCLLETAMLLSRICRQGLRVLLLLYTLGPHVNIALGSPTATRQAKACTSLSKLKRVKSWIALALGHIWSGETLLPESHAAFFAVYT